MKNITMLVSMGSGCESWLTIQFDTLSFMLETERSNGKISTEALSVDELKIRLPGVANSVADEVARGIQTGV